MGAEILSTWSALIRDRMGLGWAKAEDVVSLLLSMWDKQGLTRTGLRDTEVWLGFDLVAFLYFPDFFPLRV